MALVASQLETLELPPSIVASETAENFCISSTSAYSDSYDVDIFTIVVNGDQPTDKIVDEIIDRVKLN